MNLRNAVRNKESINVLNEIIIWSVHCRDRRTSSLRNVLSLCLFLYCMRLNVVMHHNETLGITIVEILYHACDETTTALDIASVIGIRALYSGIC